MFSIKVALWAYISFKERMRPVFWCYNELVVLLLWNWLVHG